ncbi:ACP S-malonyltransferase [Clostridium sp. DJ247]|uniref:ACP S-malonyltransferase n=1 Tax=Clostridium sp. DJ247 TaxID=2726188 RepID=UPI00162AC7EA|nr:ACP S-malonyltransferase [Clostridium sp. DJ247]MBC2580401.1 ACP S-malonyltransferase [Clostridium sp. DJ247]
MKAYLFPGQGSQFIGMGRDLFKEFQEIVKIADEVLGYSIEALCLEDKDRQLGITKYTQPALYVVNVLSYLKAIKDKKEKPDFVAGHSLGEYSALQVAGVFSFETGLKIVRKRAELMNTATGGAMAAVIGLTEYEVRGIINNNFDSIDIANLNAPKQIVISGPGEDIKNAKAIFEKSGARAYVILKVSGAFHSRYMNDAAKEFKEYISQFEFSTPSIPIISNLTARPYKYSEIVTNMVGQMVGSVKWTETVCYLMGKKEDIEISQLGPGSVIEGLIRTIRREAKPLIIAEENGEVQENQESAELEETNEIISLLKNELEVIEDTGESTAKDRIVSGEIKTLGDLGRKLGNADFKNRYGLKYAYLLGSMSDGVSSKELVIKAGKSGCMAFLGTKGISLEETEKSIIYIKKELNNKGTFGVNLFFDPITPQKEKTLVDVLLRWDVKVIEASAYITLSSYLVKYRIKGLRKDKLGNIECRNKVIAKVSSPHVAKMFMLPPPSRVISKLLKNNDITDEEAKMAQHIPVADDICIEGDSAGSTEQGNILSLLPTILRLRNELALEFPKAKDIKIGVAGGIGTPESAAGVFLIGAEFILTGSINQCTVESGTSVEVKELLQQVNVDDIVYIPSLEMFELGRKAQVIKKGSFFSARVNKLYQLLKNTNSIGQLDCETKTQLEERYFNKSINDILEECKKNITKEELEIINNCSNPEIALVFKWYVENSKKEAIRGEKRNKINYNISCSPALGAFNEWVKGTDLELWKNRNVDKIALMIMDGAAEILERANSILT